MKKKNGAAAVADEGFSNAPKGSDAEKPRRVTFLLPPDLDNLLETYCSGRHNAKQKNEVARLAIRQYLLENVEDVEKALNSNQEALKRLRSSPSRR